MSVRAAKKQATRDALVDHALELFNRRGYEAVTMDDIADAAGVSRRTAFRYFPTKDLLVVDAPMSWITVFDDAVGHADQLDLRNRLYVGSVAVAAFIEAHPEPVRLALGVAMSHASLADAMARVNRRWIDRMLSEILRDRGDVSPEELVRARMVASAIMGMIDAVCEHWAEHDVAMQPLIDDGFAMLDPAIETLG